ncbi:MAG: hypothetical protein ACPG3V_04200 [Porticoccaceae bacterium]
MSNSTALSMTLPSKSISSSLMPQVLESDSGERGVTVLDFGMAAPATVAFFSQFRCKLYFAGLNELPADQFDADDLGHGALVKQLQAAINLPVDEKIDIVLFWDLFCFLTMPAVTALVEALSPHLKSSTRAHSISLLNNRTQLPACSYGIQSVDRLVQLPRVVPQPTCYAHSRQDLNSNLSGWTIDRSCLLADGRVESILFTHRERY